MMGLECRPSDSVDLPEIYAFALELAKQAGQMLLNAAGRRESHSSASAIASATYEEKDSSVDIVTQTDKDVESYIYKSVMERFPSHTFVGEESYSSTEGKSKKYLIPSSGPAWCVDPLDGTVNFLHLCPFYCVSIAFILNGEPVVGAICAPFLKQTFSACRGKGAWLNESVRLPLDTRPLPVDSPKGCILSCEWGKDRRDMPNGNLPRKVESFTNLASEIGGRDGKGGMVHGIRSLGSATLDLAYTAMGALRNQRSVKEKMLIDTTGSFDIWWEGGCWEWDVAAGICVLQEAGGLITTAHPPEMITNDTLVPSVHLGSRLYLAIRPALDTSSETGRHAQERTVREVWKRVSKLDYTRPGI